MSAQTDCEMLFVEIMEAYAGMYNLSGNDVAELFHENQVFEKVLIQHEYLHQISFEEAVLRFYSSDTYKTLQETENGLWAESAEYIADRYYDELK